MKSDFLVIGSGIAGLSYALRMAEIGSVILITKKEKIDSATNLAQGGIAAVIGKDDSYELHIKDTLASGDGLCDKKIVDMVVHEGPERVKDLISIGVDFIKNDSGYDLGREGGHSRRRIAHAYDLTGHAIETALIEKVKTYPNIQLIENCSAIDLILSDDKTSCLGCFAIRKEGKTEAIKAKITTLCAGGCGKVYLYTTNPDISSGDGIAMAYRAGAEITNMEFVQFHPTCLYHPLTKNFLISEAVRGEGGILVNNEGKPFMKKYEEMADLATRDKVARAIDHEMKINGYDCVYLDITEKSEEFLQKRFPTIFNKCLELGINISKDPIPVVPAAHYMCGGIKVDKWGKTSIKRLFALGETSNTGLHGGNRLASNSLLEAVVFAERAAKYCKDNWEKYTKAEQSEEIKPPEQTNKKDIQEKILINHNWDVIRRTMWNYVGIVRNKKRLELAKDHISDIIKEVDNHIEEYSMTKDMLELRNISQIAMMIIEASLKRRKSRGLHYISDQNNDTENEFFWNIFVKGKNEKGWNIEYLTRYENLDY